MPEGELPVAGEVLASLEPPSEGEASREPITFRVAPGSRLIVPPIYGLGGNDLQVGYLAVLHVDSADVIQAYREQAVEDFPVPSRTESWETSGFAIDEEILECLGGCGRYESRAVIESTGQGTLIIRVTPRT